MIIFWDIDGTLIENDPHNVNLYNDALKQTLRVTAVTPPSHHGKVDKQIIHEYLTVVNQPVEHYVTVKAKLDELSLQHYLNPVTARKQLPAAETMLTLAADAGHINALFTGNSSHRSQAKLEGAGFNLGMFNWGGSFFGSEYDTRPAMAEAAKQVHVEAIMVGDTPGDGVAANTAGFHFIAVCTGVYGAEDLKPYKPVLLIENFQSGADKMKQLLHSIKYC